MVEEIKTDVDRQLLVTKFLKQNLINIVRKRVETKPSCSHELATFNIFFINMLY